MDNESIYSADQIKIPANLSKILRDYTKAVIKANPENLIEFSYLYFKDAVEQSENKPPIDENH